MKRLVFVFVLAIASLQSYAQTAQEDGRHCGQSSRNFEQIIASCTHLLAGANDFDRMIILNYRAMAYMDKGDTDSAISDLSELIRLRPSATVYELRGTQRQDKGQQDKAAADFEEAEARGMNTIRHYLRLAFAHMKLNQEDRAMRDLNFALLVDPASVTALYWRGLLWQRKDDHRAALVDFDTALLLSPDVSEIVAARARSQTRLNSK